MTCANSFPQSVQDDPASPGPVRETLLAVDCIWYDVSSENLSSLVDGFIFTVVKCTSLSVLHSTGS